MSLLIVDLSEGYEYYQTFFSGFLTVILLEFLHFRSQPHDPDNHALRRSRHAALIFTLAMWVYSAALIVLGTSYKMFLFEFVFADLAKEKENEDSHRNLWVLLQERFLAGSTSSALRFETEDRQQRIAHFFSGSMALVWFCLDVTILAHGGTQAWLKRLHEQHQEKRVAQWVAATSIALRVCLIGFIATVSQYMTDPAQLASMGLAGVLCQLALRVILSYACPMETEETESEAIERMAHHLNARLRS